MGLYVCLVLFAFTHLVTGLQCWNCQNVDDIRECMAEGFIEICSSREHVCESTIRRENGIRKLFKQCKQRTACQSQMLQNDFFENGEQICNDENESLALCACCCHDDHCNIDQTTCMESMIHGGDDDSRCPRLGKVYHGEVNCTDEQNIGSQCNYRCLYPNYSVYPSDDTTLTCLPSGEWDKEEPCCALPCPPHAVFDFIVIKYVSSSESIQVSNDIGRRIPKKLVPFSDDGFQLTRIQFSGDIHHDNKILFNQFPSEATALNNNTRDGQANAGRALRWAYDNLRDVRSGNRQNVKDVVIVVTDTTFDDDVSVPSQAWREAGALVYVERHPNNEGTFASYEQMLKITNDPSRIFTLRDRSPDAIESLLDEQFEEMCKHRCSRLDV